MEKLKIKHDDKGVKIWFTEIGCPGMGGRIKSKGWWMGKSSSEEEQAEFISYVYADVIKLPNAEKVFWAFFRDNKDHFKNDMDYFGLVRWDFSKKPAFNKLKESFIYWLKTHAYLQPGKQYE